MKTMIVAALTLFLSGCAVSFVDKSGFEHTVGMFHQKVKTDNNLLHVQRNTVGLSISLAKSDAGVNFGYKQSYRVFVPDNTVLTIDSDGSSVPVLGLVTK